MNSLVADYGDSGSESSLSEDSDVEEEEEDERGGAAEEEHAEGPFGRLPGPDFNGLSSANSVFSNPFAEAEKSAKAVLEKHVKMVNVTEKKSRRKINRKKICLNLINEGCKLGSSCPFSHNIAPNVTKNKTRPGLSPSIMPSKKVMKAYKRNKLNDAKKSISAEHSTHR